MRRRPAPFLPVAALSIIAACQASEPQVTRDAIGVIEEVHADRTELRIAHEEIPGFMDAMTMTFGLANPNHARDLEPGEKVQFTFTMDRSGKLTILRIQPLSAAP